MARIVVNKHTYVPSEITASAFTNPGQIIVSNKVDEEDIYVINSESGITGIRKSTEELVLNLSGGVYNTFPTYETLNDTIENTITEVKEYSDNNDAITLDSAVTYTNEVRDRLEDIIHNITSASSASYESLLEKFDDYATSADTVTAIIGAKEDAIETTENYTDGQISNVTAEVEAVDTKVVAAYNMLSGDISGLTNDLRALSGGTITEISNLSENVELTINEFSGNVTTYIDGKLSKVYKFKESVERYQDLLDIENPENGDVYNVIEEVISGETIIPAGTNFAWDGDGGKWDELGGIVDLSSYLTSAETATAIANALDEGKDYTDSEINKLSGSVKTISGSIVTTINQLSAGTEDAIDDVLLLVSGLSGDVVTALDGVLDEAKDYTDDLEERISAELSGLNESIVSLSGNLESNYWTSAETKGYVDSQIEAGVAELSASVITLSGSVVDNYATSEYVEDEIDNTQNYINEVAEVISTALSAVSGTVVSALQDVQFGPLEEGYEETHIRIRTKREGNIITIDLSNMDINGGDY